MIHQSPKSKLLPTQIGLAVALAMIVFLLALPLVSQASAASGQPKSPKSGHAGGPRPIYWGAWIGSQLTGTEAPWDMNAVSAFAAKLGKQLSLIEFASPMADCNQSPCSFFRFPTSPMQSIRDYGAIPFFSWSTSSTPANPTGQSDPDFQLSDIIAGKYDPEIIQFASEAAAWGHPFFLRFNWEMNGDWFPWAEGINGNQPGEYVAAWRHVHDIFTAVGATNATWVWCPYVEIKRPSGNLRASYPGNAYVDWTCLDGFNWAQNSVNPQKWRSFDQIFRDTYRRITTKIAPRKPMLLAEMASGGPPRAKAAWIRDTFQQLRTNYRRIRGLIWFDKIDRGVDWPLDTARASGAFAAGIAGSAFRQNRYANLEARPIKPAHVPHR